MGFLAPAALVAVPLLGVIAALYLLRMRRPSAPIASLSLWSESTRSREANALWQRLQLSVLLLLQLLALLALILALARPWVTSSAEGGRSLVLIVDISASMGALDGDDKRRATRLDVAKEKALDLIDGLEAGSIASVITADSDASVVLAGADDKARLRSAISGLSVKASAPTDLNMALKLASGLAAKQGDSVIWILSDGRFSAGSQQSVIIPSPVRYFRVGSNGSNQAITAMSLDRRGGSLRLFVQLMNADVVTVTRRVDVVIDDIAWNARNVTLPPGALQELILEDLPLGSRVVRAGFSGPDIFPSDDRAWTVNRAAATGTVLLVTKGNKFLESALALLPDVILYKVAPDAYDPVAPIGTGGLPNLTVFDAGTSPADAAALPAGNMLMIAPGFNSALVQATTVITGPTGIGPAQVNKRLSNLDSGSSDEVALLKFVDFSQVHVQRTDLLSVPAWGSAILSAQEGALLVAGENDGRRVAALGFDLGESDLPLRPAFPLLVRNLVTYLLPEPAGGLPASVPPGNIIPIEPIAPEVDRILVEDPAGKEWSYTITTAEPRVAFNEALQQGVYYISEYILGEIVSQEAFAVNLFSRVESTIMPVAAPSLPPSAPPGEATARRAGQPLEVWPIVALAGFALLLVEWLYAQRIVIRRAITEWRTRRALDRMERT